MRKKDDTLQATLLELARRTADEEGILESFKHPVDLSQESYTQPLINFVNENALN